MQKKKILLVDDVDIVLFMEKAMLGSPQYQISTAKNGQEALDKVASEKPDLVLLDISMPDIDGCEVCRRIKADPETGHIKVVMVTVNNEEMSAKEAREAGCDAYHTKPIHKATLRATIDELLGA